MYRKSKVTLFSLLIELFVADLFLIAIQINGYSTGPPTSACGDMTPCSTMTGGQPSQSLPSSPYTTSLSSTCYAPNQMIQVNVVSSTSNFRGIFVQVKTSPDNNTNYGIFDAMGDPELKTLVCFEKNNSALSHATNSNKTAKTFKWFAPSLSIDLEFLFTIVNIKTIYWVGIKKSIPSCQSTTLTTTSIVWTTTTSNTTITTSKLNKASILGDGTAAAAAIAGVVAIFNVYYNN